MRKFIYFLFMMMILSACSGGGQGAIDQPANHRLLFIGNSFTGNNELDSLVSNLLNEAGGEWGDNFTTRSTTGGYKFIDHLQDIQEESRNARLRTLLVTGNDTVRDWDWVVIQEQSQVLGFPAQNGEKISSINAARQITQVVSDTNATVLIMMTWGYAFGDDGNQTLFPDYLTMQRQLVLGTNDVAKTLSSQGNQVYIIPAGWAFQLVYEDVESIGRDPLADGSRFRALYSSDNRHPSLAGSYLAASVVTAVYTGQSVANLQWQPRGLDADFAAYLRDVADRVVFGQEFPAIEYPAR